MTRHLTPLAAAMLLSFGGAAQALSFTLSPPLTTVNPGDTVSVSLLYDFSADPTLGGGVDLFYDDAILSFVGFTFDTGFPDDPLVRRLPDVFPDELNGLAFGEFTVGIAGSGIVGIYTFTALMAGSSTLVLAENDSPAGGFFSAMSFDAQDVDYGKASVTVNQAAVPEPGVLALLGLGLAGVALARRRRAA